jgi:hypothetical protein
MEKKELKKTIAKLLNEGNSLSDIQKILDDEHGEKMTFLDLRMLASEIEDIDWTKDEEPEAVETDDEGKEETVENSVESEDGKTVIEVSKLTRPGVALSGSVKFASGASAEWVLDQMGRLAFEKSDGKPTEEDLAEFQEELKKSLGAG